MPYIEHVNIATNTIQVLVLRLFVLMSALGVATSAVAQFCDGNLGENIFVDGDFGRGNNNIVSPDPQIAPGFNYAFTGPPRDGQYTITNNTGVWPGLYGPWLAIGDNSPDPTGYMMVVNASFDPGLFYEQTIDGLCENTQYQFSADIINMIKPSEPTPHIRPNVSFLIDGSVQFTTGEITATALWDTYAFTFSTDPGQTSVTLALSNSAPGGIGNDLGLDNISFRACGPRALILPFEQDVTCEDGSPVELTATIDGDQFPTPALQWQQSFDQGITWQDIPGETNFSYLHTDVSSGFYFYRYLLANGSSNLSSPKCRVVSNSKVVFVQPKFYNQVDTLCEGLSFSVGTSSYDATGTYIDTLTSFYGCDSIITTALVIVPDTDIQTQLTVQFPSCSDIDNGRIEATLPTGGAPPFMYSFENAVIINGQLITGLGAGTYDYAIEDRFGCTFESNVSLVGPPQFAIELGPDISLELGEEARVNVQVSGGSAQAIEWAPAEAVICDPPCTDFVLQPTESVQIVAEAINENGCIATDSILLDVLKVRKHFFPTAFSPNGDGVNDYFTGFGASPNVQLIEGLIVANRWGNIVYSRNNLQPGDLLSGWDGSSRDKPLDEGVYAYTARVLYFDGVVEQVSGEVSLVR